MTTREPGATLPSVHAEIQRLGEAMRQGHLDARADADHFQGTDAATLEAVNQMLDAVVAPLRVAAGAIDELAHGRIPPFILDDQVGGDHELKRNLNTLLATLYGIHNETRHLVANIRDGKLRSRGNDWDYEGIWRELIGGVNGTLDAVIAPVNEASAILGRLADYDLAARMRGRYRGEHAVIKRAMNATAGSLRSAIAQVGESVAVVSEVGANIAQSSQAVSEGASNQELQLAQATSQLGRITDSSDHSTQSVQEAERSAQVAAEAIAHGKDAMEQMLSTMAEIVTSADNMAVIVHEIDSIAKETNILSSSASAKAKTVRSSADGFSVVADTIRSLADRCEAAVVGISRLRRDLKHRVGDDTLEAVEAILKDLKRLTDITELLGINAAVEAAHVSGAGQDFAQLTEEIRKLALRSADAAKRTERLIQASILLVHNGKALAQAIDEQLEGAVEGAAAIRRLTGQISEASQEQGVAVGQISQAVDRIRAVTHRNAAAARASSADALDLQAHVQKLAAMVEKFRLEDVG